MKKISTILSINSKKTKVIMAVCSLLFSYNLQAQIFWTENFNNGCSTLCPETVYASVNGAWTMTDASPAVDPCGSTTMPNEWYVSCAENGHTPGVCGTGCAAASATSTLATLHIANVPNSPNGGCPLGDCGAAYDAGGWCDVLGTGPSTTTDKRAESPTINCTGHVGITINFNYIMGGQNAQDFCNIEYFDGATWNWFASPSMSVLCGGQGTWAAYSFALPAVCDNNPNVKIGFHWINDDDGSGADPSFAVDDVTLSSPAVGNTITTGVVTGPFCACSTINVPFSSTGTYGAGNVYKAQLSDAAGSFAAPVNIGTLASTANAGNISCTIPCNTPAGAGYLIQVVSTNPFVTGSNNGVNITINAADDATFSYSAPSYCQAGANPTPIINLPGGSFVSTPAGLTINAATGLITVATSAINCYNITYTTAGPCPSSTTNSICITSSPAANFSYTGTPYCTNAANPSPTYSAGGFAGSFTATPAGLVFLGTAGQVDLSASTPGTYSVTNNIAAANGCPAATFSSNITITAVGDSTFAYPSTALCQAGGNAIPVISGTLGGTFTSVPATLVFVNTTSGEINVAGSPLGTFNVTYTTPGLCATSLTTVINITLAPVATFSYTASPYCQSAVNPLPTYSGGGSAGTFTATPAGLTFISIATGEVDLINSLPNTYTVTNTIAASGGCPLATATSTITIIATPSAGFSYIGSPYCTAGLNPSPTFNPGAVGGTFTSTPAGLTINATGAVTLNTSSVGTYTVTNTIFNVGCPNSVAPATIQIIAAQSATFSYAGSPYCSNGTNPSPTFSGGGIAGTFTAVPASLIINAASGLVTLTGSPAGTYTVTNTIAATSSCPADSAIATITIVTAPTVGVNSGSVCAGGTFTLTGTGATSYTWSAGATSTGVATATVSPVVTTTYTVTGTTGSCSNTAVATVTISPPLPITVNSPTICTGQTAILFASGGTTYTWTAGANGIVGTDTATASPSLTTSYTVTGTTAGCTGTAVSIVTVQVCNPPAALFSGTPLVICTSGCVNFTDLSTNNPTSWAWQFPGGVPATSTLQNPGSVCYTYDPLSCSHPVILTVSNQYGDSTWTIPNYVTVVLPQQVQISPDNPMVNACDPKDLTANPDPIPNGCPPGNLSPIYDWGTFAGSISCSTCQTATITPTITEQYWVQYTDNNGCYSTDTTLATVTTIYSYFMPTGIAPNGDNIVDRLLKVHGTGISYMNLKIFDRVGEKVFETSDYDEKDPKAGTWDGTLHGLPMNENTFVYELTVTYCDQKTVKENGSIMLVK